MEFDDKISLIESSLARLGHRVRFAVELPIGTCRGCRKQFEYEMSGESVRVSLYRKEDYIFGFYSSNLRRLGTILDNLIINGRVCDKVKSFL